MNTDILETLYKTFTGKAPEAIEPLPGAGSNRRYFRLKGEQTLIGVIGTSVEENRTFLYMASHFHHKMCIRDRISRKGFSNLYIHNF